MYVSKTAIRVRYGETDQMGCAYYGAYALYYEVARVESLRRLGMSYKSLESMGVGLPVCENYARYLAPARYDDLLTVVAVIKEMPAVRLRFDYEVMNEAEQKINIGHSVLAFVDKNTGRPRQPPPAFLELLNPFFK